MPRHCIHSHGTRPIQCKSHPCPPTHGQRCPSLSCWYFGIQSRICHANILHSPHCHTILPRMRPYRCWLGIRWERLKSVSGYCFHIHGCLVSWLAQKQKIIASSSTEAEYYLLSYALREGLWLHLFLPIESHSWLVCIWWHHSVNHQGPICIDTHSMRLLVDTEPFYALAAPIPWEFQN